MASGDSGNFYLRKQGSILCSQERGRKPFELLGRDPIELVGSFDRPNLVYRVLPRATLKKQLGEILERLDVRLRRGQAGHFRGAHGGPPLDARGGAVLARSGAESRWCYHPAAMTPAARAGTRAATSRLTFGPFEHRSGYWSIFQKR